MQQAACLTHPHYGVFHSKYMGFKKMFIASAALISFCSEGPGHRPSLGRLPSAAFSRQFIERNHPIRAIVAATKEQ
jgi:hypothetical protein